MTRPTSPSLLVLFWALLCGTATADTTFSPLGQANALLERWTARKDADTNLLSGDDDTWTIRTTAARLYPAVVLTAWFTNPHLYGGLLQETLHDEQRLTSRIAVFPDDYQLENDRFARSSQNPEDILANAAAYAGGLARVAGVVGHGPWTDRLRGIVDAAFLRADVATGYAEGALPSDDIRVTGHLLRALPLLADLYDDDGYLYYARRIADAYCVGVLPANGGLPARRWNFASDRARAAEFPLDDDGVSLIEGLVALFAREAAESSARAAIYRPTLSAMFDALFTHGLGESGRFHRRIQPDGRGGYSIDRRRRSAETVRILNAAYHYGRLSGNTTYVERALAALSRYRPAGDDIGEIPAFLSAPEHVEVHDSGTIVETVLSDSGRPLTTLGETESADLLEALLSLAWSRSAGVRTVPWREDLSLTGRTDGRSLTLTVSLEAPWQGRLIPPFDRIGAPVLAGGFPSTFTLRAGTDYEIRHGQSLSVWAGALLTDGIAADFATPFSLTITSLPLTPAPTGP